MSFVMPLNMPVKHIAVKHDYAFAGIDAGRDMQDVRGMERLREWRKARDLSQEQLAEMVGVNQATISKAERGGTNITLDLIEKLAVALRVPAHDLFSVPEYRRRINQAIESMDPAKREAALVVLESMARSNDP